MCGSRYVCARCLCALPAAGFVFIHLHLITRTSWCSDIIGVTLLTPLTLSIFKVFMAAPYLLLFHRGAPRRRPAPAAAIQPCRRSTPLLPPTRRKVKARRHPWAGSRLLTSAPRMPAPNTPSIPSCGCIRALSWTGPRPWHPATR